MITPEELRTFINQSKKDKPEVHQGETPSQSDLNWSIKDYKAAAQRASFQYGPVYKTGQFFEGQGSSKYDEGIPFHEVTREGGIQDWRADQQSLADKWGNVAANFGTVAATSFINNTVGGVWGLAEGLVTWDGNKIIDNTVANWTQDMQEAVGAAMPLYRSSSETEMAWYQQLGKANFWGDIIISQGFTAGVISAMALTGGVIGMAQRGMQSYRLSKGVFELGTKGQFGNTVKTFGAAGFEPAKATNALIKAGVNAKRSDTYRSALSSLYSSHGYATTEAISHTRQFEEELRGSVEAEWNKNLPFVTSELKRQVEEELGFVSEEEVWEEVDKRLAQEYENTQEQINRVVNSKRNLNYGLNLGYLTLTNMAAWGSFAKGNYPTMKAINTNLVKKTGAGSSTTVEANILSPFQKVRKGGGRILKNPGIQFAEETALHINREGTGDFFRSRLDPDATKKQSTFLEAYLERVFGTLGNIDEWESGVRGFIGGLLGGVGPRIQGGKVVAPYIQGRGGLFETVNVFNTISGHNALANQHAEGINRVLDDENLQRMYASNVANTARTTNADQALFLDDRFTYDNESASEFIELMLLYNELGIPEQFMEFIEIGKNLTAEDVRKAVAISTDAEGNKLEVSEDPLSHLSDEEITTSTRETVKRMNTMREAIQKNVNNIESLVVHRGFEGERGKAYRDEILHYIGSLANMAERKGELITELSGIPGGSDFTSLVLAEAEATKKYVENPIDANREELSEISANLKKLWKEMIDNAPVPLELDSEYNQLLGVSYRIDRFKDLYNALITEEGAKEFNNNYREALEQAKKMNSQEASAIPQADVVEVPDIFKEAIEQTTYRETYVDGDRKSTKDYKGLIEVDVGYRDSKEDRFKSTKWNLEVDGIDKKGNLKVKTKENKYLLSQEGRILDHEGNTLDAIWTDYKVVETGVARRNESRKADFSRAIDKIYIKDNNRVEYLGNRFLSAAEGLKQVNKLVKEFGKKGKERRDKIKIKVTPENKEVLKKALGDNWKDNIKVAAITTKELQDLATVYRNIKKDVENTLDEFEKLETEFSDEYMDFDEYNAHLRRDVEALRNLSEEADISANNITEKITNIRNWVNKLDKTKNRLKEAIKVIDDSEPYVQRRIALERGDFEAAAEALTEIEALLDNIDIEGDIEGIDSNIAQARLKIQGLDTNLSQILEKIQPDIEAQLSTMERVLNTREAIAAEFNRIVLNTLVGEKKATVAKKEKAAKPQDSKSKGDPATTEQVIAEDIPDVTPELHPFTDSPRDMLVTIANQEKWMSPENASEFESQLAFQDFIESYDVDSGTHILKAMSREQLLDLHFDNLTEQQLKNIQSDEAKGAAFVIIYNREVDSAETVKGILSGNEGKNLIMLSVLPVGSQEDSLWINRRPGGTPILGYETYIRSNLNNAPFKDVADQIRKKHEGIGVAELVDRIANTSEIQVLFNEKFHKNFDVYETEVRSKIANLKVGEAPTNLPIIGKTPGRMGDTSEDRAVSDVVGKENLGNVEVQLGTGKTISIAGTEKSLEAGIVNIVINDRLVPVQRQTLTPDSINDVTSLLEGALNAEGEIAFGNIYNAIRNVVYIQDKAPTDKRDINEYNLYITSDKSKIIYGKNKAITKQELESREGDKFNDFVEFLETKYYNVRQDELDKSGYDFEEKIYKDGELVTKKVWTSDEGGYKGYLMSGEGDNISKFTVNLPARGDTGANKYESPIFTQRAFKYKHSIPEPLKTVEKNTSQAQADSNSKAPRILSTGSTGLSAAELQAEMAAYKGEAVPQNEAPAPTEATTTTAPDEFGQLGEELSQGIINDSGSLTKEELEIQEKASEQKKLSEEEADRIAKEEEQATKDALDGLFLTTPVGVTSKEKALNDLDAFKKVFPDTEIHIDPELPVEARMTFIREKGINVYLRPVVAEKAEWHEGFHIVERLFTSKEDLQALYTSERKRLGNRVVEVEGKEVKGSEMSDAQMSEFLAEEFRNYVIVGRNNYKWGEAHQVKKGWFERLWDSIKELLSFFHFSRTPQYAEAFFSRIEEGKFPVNEIINNTPVTANRVGDLSAMDSRALVGYMDYIYFDIIHNDPEYKNATNEVLDSSETMREIYLEKILPQMLQRKKEASKVNMESSEYIMLEKATNIKDKALAYRQLISAHIKHRKIYGSTVRLTQNIVEDTLADVETPKQFVEHISINVREYVKSNIKRLVAGLPKINSKNELVTTLGLPSTIDYNATIGHLHKHLEDLESYEQMIDKLHALSDKFPHYRILLDRLESEPGDYWKGDNDRLFNLRIDFFRQFFKSESEFVIGVLKEEGIYFLDGTAEASERFVVEQWKARAATGNLSKSIVPSNNLYSKEDGKLKINPDAGIVIGGKPTNIREILNNANKDKLFTLTKFTGAVGAEQQQQTYSDFLHLFGITIPSDYQNTSHTSQMTNFIIKNIPEVIKKNKGLYLEDIYNKEGAKINKEIKALAKDLSDLGDVFIGNQYIDGKGIINYNLNEKNKIARVVDSISNGEIPIELRPFDGTDGNVHTIGSRWLGRAASWNKAKGKFEGPSKAILKAFGEERSDKTDTSELKNPDFIAMEINAILNGIAPYLRSADRSLEYGFNFDSDLVRFDLSKQERNKIFTEYLKGEIVSALAYRNDPEVSNITGSENLKKLSVFSDIVPQIDKALNKAEEVSPSEYFTEAEKILKAHRKDIEQGLEYYFNTQREALKKLLIENGVITKTTGKEGNTYDLFAFDAELLISKYPTLEGKMDAVSEADFNTLLDIINFEYISSGIEQTKLITGNPLYYVKGKGTQFHKRTTTFASTHTPSVNSPAFVRSLNRVAPRIDGTNHTENVIKLTREDVIVTSDIAPLLKKLGFNDREMKAYTEMTENDAGAKFTFDGYESFSRRNGSWSEGQDKTMQYHKQWFFRDMINSNIHPEIFNEARFKEVFKKHLPKKIAPGKMYYKGEEVDGSILESLGPKKPVGQGIIQNPEYLAYGVPDINKLAAFYQNPFDLRGKAGYAELISAVAAGVDFITPKSAVKGPAIGNKEGKLSSTYDENGRISLINDLIEAGYKPTLLNWNDLGDQLEIDPEGHDTATYSSQMRRIATVDAIIRGIPRTGMERFQSVISEFNSLHREKVSRELSKVLNRLGIEKLSESGRDEYKLVEDERLLHTILNEIERRQVADNVAESIKIVLSNTENRYFDTLPTKRQIVNLLQGLIRNNVIKTKFNGDMLVQEPSTGYEGAFDDQGNLIGRKMRNGVLTSNHLRPPRPIHKDGTEYTEAELSKLDISKIERVAPGQTMLPLPKKLIPWVKKMFPAPTFHDSLNDFNKAFANPKWSHYEELKKMFTMVANRTPLQHLNSIEVLEVFEFTAPEGGPKAIVYSEIVAKSGSDFDIDKITAYFNNFRINEAGNPEYMGYTQDEDILYERYIVRQRNTKKLRKLLKEFGIKEEEFDLKEAILNFKQEELKELEGKVEALFATSLENLISDIIVEETKVKNKEDFKALPMTEKISTKEIENRINEIVMELALAPENYKTLMTPNNADLITDLADKYAEEHHKEASSTSQLVTPTYNFGVAKSQFTANKLIGIVANADTSHSTTQQFPIRIDNSMLELFFDSFKEKEGDYTLGYYQDQNNNIISLNIGNALLSAVVDAGDYTIPPTDILNFTTSTSGTYLMLNRMGKGDTNPSSMEDIAHFMTRPVIRKIEQALRINESQIRSNFNRSKEKKEVILDILSDPKFGISPDKLKDRKFLYEYLEDVLKGETKFHVREAKKIFKEKLEQFKAQGIYLNGDNMSSNPLMTIETFLYLQEFSKLLRTFQDITRHDAGLAKNRESVIIKQEILRRFQELDIFNSEDLQKIYDESFIGGFREAHDESFKAFNQFDAIQDVARIKEFVWGESGVIKPHLNPMIAKPLDDIATAAIKIQNAAITYLLHTVETELASGKRMSLSSIGSDKKGYYEYLMKGKNGIARRLEQLKHDPKYENLHNAFIDQVVPVIEEYVPRRGENSKVEYVKFYNRKLTPGEANIIQESIVDLLESGDDVLVKLATDLVPFSIIMSGTQTSPVSFFEHLPVDKYYNTVSRFIDKFKKGDFILDYQAKRSIANNLRHDRNVVPRVKAWKALSTDKLTLSIKDNNKNALFEHVAVEINEGTKQAPKHKLYVFERTGQKKGIDYIYRRLDQKGDQFRMFDARPLTNVPAPERLSYITKGNYEVVVGDNTTQTDQAQLSSIPLEETQIQEDKALTKALESVWNRMGISTTTVDKIYLDGREVDAVAKANSMKKTIEYVEGKRGIDTLAEETWHVLFDMMPDTNVLKKKMLNDIVSTPYYNEVVAEYSDVYKGNEILLKKEAIGKALADATINENRHRMDNSLWGSIKNAIRGIMNWFKEALNIGNPYNRAAVNLFNEKYSNFTEKVVSLQQDMLQRSTEGRLRDLDDYASTMLARAEAEKKRQNLVQTNKNTIQSFLSKADEVDMASEDREVLALSEADMLASEDRIIEVNKSEIKKVSPELTLEIERQIADFDNIYPLFAETITTVGERRTFLENIQGKLKLIC